jgi:hypothetical protein
MNLQDEILTESSKRMAESIDFGIISDMLVAIGWTKVVLTPMTHETSTAIDQWIDTKIKGRHKTLGLVWIFENQSDAVNFTLRWA